MKKKIIGFIIAIIVVILAVILLFISLKKDSKQEYTNDDNVDIYDNQDTVNNEVEEIDQKIDIIDVNSTSRPYAVVINNTPVAVKVQEGLNRAYLVYEIPTEGNTSRLLAMYKDIEDDLVIGTIRSARHNFIDYALESDAIFCCFGWSNYAESDMKAGAIEYLQGLFGYPYYRENPEGLATEHTAYTSMDKLKDAAMSSGFSMSTNKGPVLNYVATDVDLSKIDGNIIANNVIIPYGESPQITSFAYDSNSKMYVRYEDSEKCIDHETSEEVTTKNIIIQKVSYKMCSNNYYWDLNTLGEGEGYYITNGYAVPIKWNKSSREEKTKYMYLNGEEIDVSDGRTWIEIQTINQDLSIN